MKPGLTISKKWDTMLIRKTYPFGTGYPLKAIAYTAHWGASKEILIKVYTDNLGIYVSFKRNLALLNHNMNSTITQRQKF